MLHTAAAQTTTPGFLASIAFFITRLTFSQTAVVRDLASSLQEFEIVVTFTCEVFKIMGRIVSKKNLLLYREKQVVGRQGSFFSGYIKRSEK